MREVSDKVLSWDETSGKKSFKKVTDLFVRETNLIYTLVLSNGEIIQTTWNHPFWVRETKEKSSTENRGGWVQTKDLKVGDLLSSNENISISLVSIESEERIETVYNFAVEDNHTYFVTRTGLLVHNQGGGCYYPTTPQDLLHELVRPITKDEYVTGVRSGTKDKDYELLRNLPGGAQADYLLQSSADIAEGDYNALIKRSAFGIGDLALAQGIGYGIPLLGRIPFKKIGSLPSEGLKAIKNEFKSVGRAGRKGALDGIEKYAIESVPTNRTLAGIETSSGLKIPKDAKNGSYIVGSFDADLKDLIKYQTKYSNVPKSDNFPLPNNQKFNMLNVDDATYKYWSNPEKGGFFKNVNGLGSILLFIKKRISMLLQMLKNICITKKS
ncbi:MAG: polymorphic toxin-type HINT domain-containing protein [Leptospiraceae bacterium]|nr:polymorphic toxin-type HINT domain-containing protein [Leptospiraceae bacterium]